MSPKMDEGFRGVSLKKELVDAVEQWIEDHPNAGYKNVAEFVHDAVRRRKEELMKTYTLTSPESQMDALFAHADVVVLPYQTCTGTSGVAHLASSYGTPIVATEQPEFQELIDHGCGVVMCKPESTDLALKIRQVLADNKLNGELRKKNQIFAKLRSWRNVAQAHLKLYKKLLKSS